MGIMAEVPKLSVVVPFFNEEKRLGRYLSVFLDFPGTVDFPTEMIFVDDGSSDSTASIIAKAIQGKKGFRLIRLPKNRGKGGAVKEGMLKAHGALRLFADADNATPIEQASLLLSKAGPGKIVIGSRYKKGAQITKKQPVLRVLGSRFLNLLTRLVLLPGISDTQCGFKLFPAEVAERVFSRIQLEGFGFDLEVLAVGRHLGYVIEEVPVVWRDDPHSTVKPLRDGWRFVRNLVRIKIDLIKGVYQ